MLEKSLFGLRTNLVSALLSIGVHKNFFEVKNSFIPKKKSFQIQLSFFWQSINAQTLFSINSKCKNKCLRPVLWLQKLILYIECSSHSCLCIECRTTSGSALTTRHLTKCETIKICAILSTKVLNVFFGFTSHLVEVLIEKRLIFN